MKNKIFFLLLSSVLVLGSCERDLGEYVVIPVDSGPYTQLRQDASTDIVLSQGAGFSIEFDGYEEIFYDLDFRVTGGKLIVSQRGHHWSSGRSRIYITVPDLTKIEITGSGDIYGDNRFRINGDIELHSRASGDFDLNLDVDEVYTWIEGSGNVRLRGYADRHEVESDGSGDLFAFSLKTRNTRITSYGSGDAEIYVTHNLYVRLRGSGDIFFSGNPFVDYLVTGSGRLIDAN